MEERIFWFFLSEEAAEDMDGEANLLISSKRGGGLLLLPPRPEATRPRAEGGCSQSLPVSLRLAVRALHGGAPRSPGDDGLFSLARSLVRFGMRHSGMPPG